jgi:hypothetical protein
MNDHCMKHPERSDSCQDCYRIWMRALREDAEKKYGKIGAPKPAVKSPLPEPRKPTIRNPLALPAPLGEAGARHKSGDHATSRAAAESFDEKRLSDIQSDVLEFARLRQEATDLELEAALDPESALYGKSTLRKRRKELMRLAYLRWAFDPATGDARTRGGCKVWELDPRNGLITPEVNLDAEDE